MRSLTNSNKSPGRFNKYNLYISTLMLFSLITGSQAFSQTNTAIATESDVRNFREELFVRTDRDIYITGEEVWFKVYELNGMIHTPSDLSKVVYPELLDNNNFPLKQLKVETSNNSGASGFILPANISSGNYVIRAYTNWMKNFSTDQFFYKTISVINPFESIDHLKLPSGNIKSGSGDTDSNFLSGSIVINEGDDRENARTILKKDKKDILYTITLLKPQYSTREKVKVEITATDLSGKLVESDLSVSVAKSGVISSTGSSSFYCFNRGNEKIIRVEGPGYLAELEGHLISGYIRLKDTGEPLKNDEVSLSYVGKKARCQFTKTDGNGEFNFVVREPGLNEIVIQPLSAEITGYYVDLKQSFSNSFSNFKPSPFYIDSSKISDINNAVVSMQINNIYENFRQNNPVISKKDLPDFYGKPENTVLLADYIELTSLREVVKEIIPDVYTLKQNGKHDFKLINKFRGQPFENKPLILVDGVPIYDFEKVLNINSKEIERADIINTRYFFSENIFDGIVSFITKKGNLSALEFDNSIFRQVYEGCQLPKVFYSADYSTDLLKQSRIPDYRNTLYWKPDMRTGNDGKAEIEFYTSDESTGYTIVVEGVSSDGATGYSSASFSVK